MGSIWAYGRPKGRNHIGIYLFETISEQVSLASADRIEKAAVKADSEEHTLKQKGRRPTSTTLQQTLYPPCNACSTAITWFTNRESQPKRG